MLRLALAATVVLVAVAPAADGSQARRGLITCGAKVSILVWPKGHRGIRSVKLPALANPHVQVWSGHSPRYPDTQYVAYVLGGKPRGQIPVANVAPDCVNHGEPVAGSVANGVTYRGQTGLRCTVGTGRFDALQQGRTRFLVLHRGRQVFLRAEATPTTASVTVPKGACRRVPVPR